MSAWVTSPEKRVCSPNRSRSSDRFATKANPGPVGVWPCGTWSPSRGCARRHQQLARGTCSPKSSTLVDDLETTTRQTGSRRRRRCAQARPPRNVARQRRHTPAGTCSAFARISWRSVVNSEIVLVATEATGPALRPVVLLGLARRRGGTGRRSAKWRRLYRLQAVILADNAISRHERSGLA